MKPGLIKSLYADDPSFLALLERKVQKTFLKGDKGEPGYTPIKGIDYFDGKDGRDGIDGKDGRDGESIVGPRGPKGDSGKVIRETVTIREELPVTEELVKDIIKVMHSLPEKDKLEVSKGIRNANSFIYKGTRYKIEELMHGAGSSTGISTNVVTQYDLQTKTQVGADVVVPLSQLTNFATLTNVVAAYRDQIPQTNGITCTITATDVTFLNADVSEIFSVTYVYE